MELNFSPSQDDFVLSQEDFERIKHASSQALGQTNVPNDKEEDTRLRSASLARSMRALDERRRLLSEGSWNAEGIEARRRAKDMLHRAQAQKHEEHQDIRALNQLILRAKCRAIRDRQVAEKRQTEQELAEAASILDLRMEEDRMAKIAKDEEERKMQRQRRAQHAKEIRDQISAKEEERASAWELRQQEGDKFCRDLDSFFSNETTARVRDKRQKQEAMQALMEENERIIEEKKKEKEREKMETLRIMLELNKKAESALEAERERQRMKKEELLRLRDFQKEQHQQRKQTYQPIGRPQISELDTYQEELVEREWRRKELERLRRKKSLDTSAQVERRAQVAFKEQTKAEEVQRDRQDFEVALRLQQEALAKEAQKITKKQESALRCAQEVRAQMEERARVREEALRKEREEARARLQGIKDQEARISDLKQKKLQELRDQEIPERYVKDVEKRVEKLTNKIC